MKTIVYFTLLVGLVCFARKAHSSHIEESGMGEAEMERRRTYCIRIARVSKRDTVEIQPVNCAPGFEFCFTSTTCCCEQIPERSNAVAIGLGIGGLALTLILLFVVGCACFRMQRGWSAAPPRSGRPPFSDTSSMANYRSKYGSSPSTHYGAPSEKYGPPSTKYGYAPGDGDGDDLDSSDFRKGPPVTISGSLPPPAYSEHSFAVVPGPAGPVMLYKPGRGSEMGSRGYTKNSSGRSSVTSWLKTQDGAPSEPRRSSMGSDRSVVRNSRPASRVSSVINEGFEPQGDQEHYMMTIPSVRSGAGTTVAASEVIYNSVGTRSQANRASSVGRHGDASTARNA
ncbi:uncharacterized protein LOC100890081 [Strongylocentrotus purpuratus]|uniref:Uncharacterized protein n=1 Tax=Strongylocentrotus purpuratus TaxID=7668 RepID=A0A7M7T5L5_STRPU|nr:uncharacterized protein LOC100890081 [Strongylocentrotus purpuratus]